MAQLWFLAGPPLGPQIYQGVIQRLGKGEALSVLSLGSSYKEAGASLAQRIQKAASPVVLVAHGLALPVALEAARLAAPALLVLSNGPVTRLDPLSQSLGGLATWPGGAALLAQSLFRPSLWLRYLASSAGLRRLVANPYVMDRDTVATLARPALIDYRARLALANYLGSLSVGLPEPGAIACPVRLIWGEEDSIYPASEADYLYSALSDCNWERIPGGQHLHPWERPWELADRLSACLPDSPIRGIPDMDVTDAPEWV